MDVWSRMLLRLQAYKRIAMYSICAIVFIIFETSALLAKSHQTEAEITVFTASKIITMDATNPYATAVAVKDGRILSVGSLKEMQQWLKPGEYQIDNTFHDDIITPGMIEPHSHITKLTLFLSHPYVGYHDTLNYDAKPIPGLKSKIDVLNKLQQTHLNQPSSSHALFAWGYDPIHFKDGALKRQDLDAISVERPIMVLCASGQTAYVNSGLLDKAGITKDTNIPGVEKDKNGLPTGVLTNIKAIRPALNTVMPDLVSVSAIEFGLKGTAKLANKVGLTTISDMLFGGPGEDLMVSKLQKFTKQKNFPLRVAIVYDGSILADMESKKSGDGVYHLYNLMKHNTDKLQFAGVKFIIDGSIQGFTALLKWPGYFNGAPNGVANITKNELADTLMPFWRANLPIHIHATGNKATDEALDTLESLQNSVPRKNALYVIEHNQMSSLEQFVRAKKLGAYTNLFPNQLYYWGDQHYVITLGPDRANDLDNTAEAKLSGIRFSLHTDSPATPLGPLHTIWAAVNRTTASGRVLGENNKISVEDALRAVTIDAAYMHNLQDEIGSVEVGKRADFTVLLYDPTAVKPDTIKDIPVIATVINGVIHPALPRLR